eukprot:2793227-Rhodomonas_salina.1
MMSALCCSVPPKVNARYWPSCMLLGVSGPQSGIFEFRVARIPFDRGGGKLEMRQALRTLLA